MQRRAASFPARSRRTSRSPWPRPTQTREGVKINQKLVDSHRRSAIRLVSARWRSNPTFAPSRASTTPDAPQVLYTRLVADLETPVSAFLKLGEGRDNAFLLESVQGGETRGRYSIIGLKPDLIWRCRDGKAEINRSARAGAGQVRARRACRQAARSAARADRRMPRWSCRPALPPMAVGPVRLSRLRHGAADRASARTRRPIRWACPTRSCCVPPSPRSSTMCATRSSGRHAGLARKRRRRARRLCPGQRAAGRHRRRSGAPCPGAPPAPANLPAFGADRIQHDPRRVSRRSSSGPRNTSARATCFRWCRASASAAPSRCRRSRSIARCGG